MKQGLMIGGIVGAILSLLTVTGGTIAYIQKRSNDMRRGWNLVPVVVTGRALSRGDRIAAGALVARQTPEQFVTSSIVKGEQLATLNERILFVDLPANSMVRWTDLDPQQPDPVRECIRRAVTK